MCFAFIHGVVIAFCHIFLHCPAHLLMHWCFCGIGWDVAQLLAGIIAEPALLSEYTIFALDYPKRPKTAQVPSVVSSFSRIAFLCPAALLNLNTPTASIFFLYCLWWCWLSKWFLFTQFFPLLYLLFCITHVWHLISVFI